jgi:hypothetical protein
MSTFREPRGTGALFETLIFMKWRERKTSFYGLQYKWSRSCLALLTYSSAFHNTIYPTNHNTTASPPRTMTERDYYHGRPIRLVDMSKKDRGDPTLDVA